MYLWNNRKKHMLNKSYQQYLLLKISSDKTVPLNLLRVGECHRVLAVTGCRASTADGIHAWAQL